MTSRDVMTLSTLTLLTLLSAGVTSDRVLEKPRHWGPPGDVVSEYKTHSDTSTVTVYKDDEVIYSTETGAGSHYSHITARVTTFGQTFVLRLIKNRYLFASTYVEKVITDDGPVYRDTNNTYADHCFYTGSVDDHPSSTASACTCYGFLGEFTVDNETYSVEPVDETLSGSHRVYRESDSTQPVRVCGYTDGETISHESLSNEFLKRKKRSLKWPQDLDGEIRVVELYVVNDKSQYDAMGSESATITRTKTIVNAASVLYHPINVYITLVGVEVWSSGNLIGVNESYSYTLNQFCDYRRDTINPATNNDNGHLITRVDFDDDILGLAYRPGMCRYTRSCAFTTDYTIMTGATAAVLAHEMGHNFGFEHDDELTRTCACDDPSYGRCIMISSVNVNNPPSTRWSQCSTDQLELSYDKKLDYCLHNVPQTIQDNTPDCGNGIVDDGEECDCGNAPTSQCNPTCCSSSTCQLTATASCAYGRCCDVANCQLKPAATECRAATGECDLPEYCNGADPDCPSDVYRRNTDSCTVNAVSAFCYNGECRSHRSQCRTWWGDNATNAHSLCYTITNNKGERGGYCGYDIASDTYTACSPSDVLCGSLQCSVPAPRTLQTYFWHRIGGWRLSNGTSCSDYFYYGSFYNGPDRPDPGLVPDGASCGTGKMCLNQRCRDVTDIGEPDCGGCSNNGVCNTLEQCHCDNGFMPPDCSQTGCGGSCHSNPASSGCGGSYYSNPASLCSPTIETTTTVPVTTTTEAVTTTTTHAATTTAPVTTTSVGETTTTAAETTSTSPAVTTTAAETTTAAVTTTTDVETTTTESDTTTTSPAMTTTVAETTTAAATTTTAVETTTATAETSTTPPAMTTTVAETTTAGATTTKTVDKTTTGAQTTKTPPPLTTIVAETTTAGATTTTAVETTSATSETSTTPPAMTATVAETTTTTAERITTSTVTTTTATMTTNTAPAETMTTAETTTTAAETTTTTTKTMTTAPATYTSLDTATTSAETITTTEAPIILTPVEIALVVLGSVFGIVGLGALIVLGVPRLIAAGGIASSLPVTPAAVRPQIYPPRSFGTRFSPSYGRPQGQQRFLNRV